MCKDCYLIKPSDKLSNNLLRLFCFFDIFKHPLSFWELKTYLGLLNKNSGTILIDKLNELVRNNYLTFYQGFYCLKDREENIDTRRRRYNYYQRKLKKAKLFAKIFSILPYVKMISLVNVFGSFNLKDEGDIDFFIITSSKRIWLSRLYCAGIAKLLNSRPNRIRKKDKICLSFYLTENNLNISKLKLKDGDPYFDFWQTDMDVLFDRGGYFKKLTDVNDNYLNKSFENTEEKGDKSILNKLEKFAKYFQLKIMPKALKEEAKNKKGVIINDNILKLYLFDKRLSIRETYEQKIRKFISENN